MPHSTPKTRTFYWMLFLPIIVNLIFPPFTYSSPQPNSHLRTRATTAKDGTGRQLALELQALGGANPQTLPAPQWAADGGAKEATQILDSTGYQKAFRGILAIGNTHRYHGRPSLVPELRDQRIPELNKYLDALSEAVKGAFLGEWTGEGPLYSSHVPSNIRQNLFNIGDSIVSLRNRVNGYTPDEDRGAIYRDLETVSAHMRQLNADLRQLAGRRVDKQLAARDGSNLGNLILARRLGEGISVGQDVVLRAESFGKEGAALSLERDGKVFRSLPLKVGQVAWVSSDEGIYVKGTDGKEYPFQVWLPEVRRGQIKIAVQADKKNVRVDREEVRARINAEQGRTARDGGNFRVGGLAVDVRDGKLGKIVDIETDSESGAIRGVHLKFSGGFGSTGYFSPPRQLATVGRGGDFRVGHWAVDLESEELGTVRRIETDKQNRVTGVFVRYSNGSERGYYSPHRQLAAVYKPWNARDGGAKEQKLTARDGGSLRESYERKLNAAIQELEALRRERNKLLPKRSRTQEEEAELRDIAERIPALEDLIESLEDGPLAARDGSKQDIRSRVEKAYEMGWNGPKTAFLPEFGSTRPRYLRHVIAAVEKEFGFSPLLINEDTRERLLGVIESKTAVTNILTGVVSAQLAVGRAVAAARDGADRLWWLPQIGDFVKNPKSGMIRGRVISVSPVGAMVVSEAGREIFYSPEQTKDLVIISRDVEAEAAQKIAAQLKIRGELHPIDLVLHERSDDQHVIHTLSIRVLSAEQTAPAQIIGLHLDGTIDDRFSAALEGDTYRGTYQGKGGRGATIPTLFVDVRLADSIRSLKQGRTAQDGGAREYTEEDVLKIWNKDEMFEELPQKQERLVALGRPAIPALIRLFEKAGRPGQDQNSQYTSSQDRFELAAVFGDIGDPRAIPVLTQGLNNPDLSPRVRQVFTENLERIRATARDGANRAELRATSVDHLLARLRGIVEVVPDGVRVLDENLLRTQLIDDLVDEASFSRSPEVQETAQRLIREIGLSLGIKEASIHPFYMARTEDQWSALTVPAYNVRTNAYPTMRNIFRAIREDHVGPVIFELAKSELGYTIWGPYTRNRQAKYVAKAYAAAIKEGYRGPLFLQGDHYQVDAKLYAKDPDKAIKDMEKLIYESILAGYRNIDVDPSTLVNDKALDEVLKFERRITTHYIQNRAAVDADFRALVQSLGGINAGTEIEDANKETDGIWSLRRKLVDDLEVGLDIPEYRASLSHREVAYIEQFGLSADAREHIRNLYRQTHETTIKVTMHFIRYIRGLEKQMGLTTPISIGVEERHIDTEKHKKFPSTVLGSMTIMGEVIGQSRTEGLVQPSKLALQTGTMHGLGGVVDWGIYERHALARKAIGVAVFVQHGTSTLPKSEFANMPGRAGEAHLATEYQKISLGTIAARVPELREKMAAYLEALVYPDREIADPVIEQKLKDSGLFDKEKREKDFSKFRPKWEAALAQEGKTRDQMLIEILGDALEGKLKGSLKDLVKFLSAPFEEDIDTIPSNVKEEEGQILYTEFRRINRDQKVVDTQEILASLLDISAQNVVLPPRPFGAVAERSAQATEEPKGEVDTTGEDGGNKQVATSLEQVKARLRRTFHIDPIHFGLTPEFSKRFLSGRLSPSSAFSLDLDWMHPLLATQLIGVLTLREGYLGKAVKEASNLGIALKDLDKETRSSIKEGADLFAQAAQGEVARLMNRHLIHENFETKGEIRGGHEAGAESGDLNGVTTPTVSDVIELTDGFVDGTPGSSSIQIEGEGAETFGQFIDEARALMVSTHINPKLVGETLHSSDPLALEKYLDPKLPVNVLVDRIAVLNNYVSPNQMNVTILTADESDIAALRRVQANYPGFKIDRVKGGTVQPAIAAMLGVNDGRVRAFIRRSGMTEAVLKTLFASNFTADGAISLFSVVSPNVKNGNDQWRNWPADLAKKMEKRPDWKEIQEGKIFSSRQVKGDIRGAYTFLTDGRTDEGLPFDVPGAKLEGGLYRAHTLVFASSPNEPGKGYLALASGSYLPTRDGGVKVMAVATEKLVKENRAASMLQTGSPLSDAVSTPSDTIYAISDAALENPITMAELDIILSRFELAERQNRFVVVADDKRNLASLEGRRFVKIMTPEAFEAYRTQLDLSPDRKGIVTIGFKEDASRMGGLTIVLPKPGESQIVSAFGFMSRALAQDPALAKVAAQLKQAVGNMPILITPSASYRDAVMAAAPFRQL